MIGLTTKSVLQLLVIIASPTHAVTIAVSCNSMSKLLLTQRCSRDVELAVLPPKLVGCGIEFLFK